MHKAYLRAIVRNSGKGRQGLGVQLFRLDAAEAAETDLTELEQEELSEADDPSSTAIMRIYEDIGEDFWTGEGITAKKFAEELDSLGDIKRLNIHINSLGGDAFTAQAIYSIIADHPAKTTSYIDGVAASAATITACGADEVVARHNTSYMIHYPWAVAVGNAEVMRDAAQRLDELTVPIVSVYKEKVRGKISEDDIKELMAKETWMSADEALEKGFVDKVRGRIRAIAKVSATQILCNGQTMNLAKYQYQNAPKFKFQEMPEPGVKPSARLQVSEPKLKGKPMTLEELTKEHPELLQTVQNNAAQAERTRLAALDAMLAPGVESIIAKAKAENKQPSDIAQECYAVAQRSLVEMANLTKLAKDAQAAALVPAGDAPVTKPEDKNAKGIKLLTAAQAKLPSQKRFQQAVGNGSRN
jgi:ATP-dependent Clp protease, protease subunit